MKIQILKKANFKMMVSLGVFVLALFLTGSVAAQDASTISGTVTDQTTGESLPGVNILVKGTAIGTSTNMDGEFELDVPSLNDTLVVSFVGFSRQEVPINGRTSIDISLVSEAVTGEELVVTGYQAQRRQDITSAVSSVNVESVNQQTSSSVLQKLDGTVSGVTVETNGSPGAQSTVRIRGIGSFDNNDPLYIVDGTPVQSTYMNFLNPNDIESMEVLKDASAASIYGSRANNGVVIIETKKGGASQGPQVTVDARTGVSTPVRGYNDFLITDALQYHEVVKRAHENAGQEVPTNIYGDPNNPTIPNYIWPNDGENQTNDLSQFDMTEDDYSFPNNLIMPASQGTDWWDAVFGPAVVQDYNVGVSGGGSDYNYNVSFNYLDQEGTAAHNRYQRGSVRVNTEFQSGRLTVGENLSVSRDQNIGGMPGSAGGEGGIIGKNILMQPVVPVYDIAGNFASGKAVTLGNNSNPLKSAFTGRNSPSKNTQLFGNVYARFDLVEDKVLVNSKFGFNLSENSGQGFSDMTPEDSEPSFNQTISEFNNVNTEWTWSNTINYVDTYAGVHNVNVVAGQEATEQNFRSLSASMSGLLNTDLSARYIQDELGDPETKNVNSSGFKASLLSFFGKADYNYDQRYHLSLTLRRDGSSRLGPNNQWGTFPAASVGWSIGNESFMADNDAFSSIMLRAGWGITGNQQIPTGRTVSQFGGSTEDTFYDITGSGSSIRQGFRQTVIGNPDLKWEQNESVNIGLDVQMYEGRFGFAVDVYERTTDDLLFAPNIPATAGVAAPPTKNVGKMKNRGIDLQVDTRGSLGNEAVWNVSFNGSHYQNEIVRIDGEQDFFQGPISTRFGNQVINRIGHPISAFRGYKTDGFFQDQADIDAHADQDGADVGRFKFQDLNEDGVINSDDRTIIGDPHPDFTGGLDFGVQYKNWEFSANLFASIGNDIFDVQKEFYVFRNFSTNVREDLLTDSWTPDNRNAKYPQIDVTDTFSYALSDFYVEDGSYLRLRNLRVAYNIPAEWIPGFRSMEVSIQGENLFTITGYDGLDPSLPAANDQYRGIDRGSYPSNKTFSLGINAAF